MNFDFEDLEELSGLTEAIENTARSTEIMAEAFLKFLKVLHMRQEKSGEQFLPVSDAAKILGFSTRKIYQDIANGYIEYGRHYINTSHTSRPAYSVNAQELLNFYKTKPEDRRSTDEH